MFNYFSASSKRTTTPSAPVIDLQGANIVVDGNSLSTATGSGGNYPDKLLTLLNNAGYNNTMTNVAVGGQTTLDMISDYATEVAPLYQSGKENILIAWEIRNHLVVNEPTVQQAYDDFETYCNLANATGFKVVALTIIPSWYYGYGGDNTVAGYNQLDTDRLAANVLLRNGFSAFSVGLADVGAIVGLADLGDNEQASYIFSSTRPIESANGLFFDGTHNTGTGKDLIAQTVYNKLVELNN